MIVTVVVPVRVTHLSNHHIHYCVLSPISTLTDDCCVFHPNVLVSFSSIPFPETIEIRNKRLLLHCCITHCAERVVENSSVTQHYGCRCVKQCGVIAQSSVLRILCVRDMKYCFFSLHSKEELEHFADKHHGHNLTVYMTSFMRQESIVFDYPIVIVDYHCNYGYATPQYSPGCAGSVVQPLLI